LTEKVQLVASIPEIHLGQADNARFNPQNVAKILRDWVNGRPLFEMAQEYYFQQTAGDDDKLTGFAQYLFGTVLGTATWGLGALEGMCLADQSEDIWKEVGYVPSLLFYGVRKREAVWLRMSGVPRVLSEGLSEIWSSEKQEPTSFEEIRTWVDSRSLDDWKRSIPTGTKLTPAQCQILWKAFSRG
jgi:hypothetical protein